MRLCTSLSLCLAAAAAFLSGPARADSRPVCAGPDDRHFPITSRIHDGPGRYDPGGGYGTFSLDLTNTTDRTCAAIHPVVVLVDSKRVLRAGQTRLEFYDGARAYPVHLETTDQKELVGPFDAGLPGFTIAPRRTVTVKVRLAVTPDAVANDVTVKAAVVQRHDDDGDWVGQSNDYRFRIGPGSGSSPGTDPAAEPRPMADGGTDPGAARTAPGDPTASRTAATDPSAGPAAPHDPLPFAEELARTGLGTPLGVITATALLLAAGGTIVLTWRRR
ncbi:hypothetical protein [Streptomyces sp. NPDC046197]|uniref:hypothetical protein n=1 Tax=Streptomyces sp. NPDC046197 TaxID=3154337 RepID=UPI0033D7C6F6